MRCKYLLISFLLTLCANANAEWFLRGTHNSWVATQMESAGAGTNTMQLKGVVFTAAGSIKFDRFGDWSESYGVGGLNGSNISVAAGSWDIKFFTDTKNWSITAASSSSSVASSAVSSSVASSAAGSIYHVRGTFNSWAEGTLMNRVGTTDNYESCVNFTAGDANGGPRFKIDPNGGWGSDAVPSSDFAVSVGWVKISFNSTSKAITVQQNLAANCASSSSSSSVTSSVTSSSAPASIYHVRGTFNSWAEGSLMSRIGTTNYYEYCALFAGSDANGGPRFKIDPNGAWGSDAVPATDLAVSSGWVKISFNSVSKAISTQQNQAFNCGVTPTATKVYFQVDKADGYLVLYVNGIERMRWASLLAYNGLGNDVTRVNATARLGEKIDITNLVGKGVNDFKLVATADSWGGMEGGYNFKVWTDSKLVVSEQQDFNTGGATPVLALEKKFSINAPAAPERRIVMVTATSDDEAIYINNVFTGKKAPAVFSLSPGEYRLGIGKSTSTILPNNQSAFTGEFHESDVVISNQDLVISSASLPLLDQPKEVKVAMVPIREMHYGLNVDQAMAGQSATAGNIGVLTDDDIVVAEKGFNDISSKYVMPFSYGMTKWKITVLPTITGRSYLADGTATTAGGLINSGAFFGDRASSLIQFGQDLTPYDLVIYVWPNQTITRVGVNANPGGGAGSKFAFIPSGWATGGTEGPLAQRLIDVIPNSGLLHEILHHSDNRRWNDINGPQQLHGAEENGYDCTSDWYCWYKDYIRAQVAVDFTTLQNVSVTPAKVLPENAIIFVGPFNIMHGGEGVEQMWSFAKPFKHIQNVNNSNCLDVNFAGLADNTSIVGFSCNSVDLNQSFSLKHVQNGAYQVVAEHSKKCVEVNQTQLVQKTCSNSNSQRFLFSEPVSGNFTIKSLGGLCLALNGTAAALETCNASNNKQQWHFN